MPSRGKRAREQEPVDLPKLREEVEILELHARKLEAGVRMQTAKESLKGSRSERRARRKQKG
jgi:hypothetical protein